MSTNSKFFIICPQEEFILGDPRGSAFDPPQGMDEGTALALAARWDGCCSHKHEVVATAPKANRRLREVRQVA